MNEDEVIAFWSYSHDDNVLDSNGILRLANSLKDEFALLTGRSLKMFVDRASIEWGNQWRFEIDSALDQSAFFILVISPRYFARPECRRELLNFFGQARSRDLTNLIMPILYVPVVNLSGENPDEAVSLISRLQYFDWTDLRLASPESADYRQAVNRLAVRLADLEAAVSATRLEREAVASSSDSTNGTDAEALEKLLQDSERQWADWLAAVEADEVLFGQMVVVSATYSDRVAKVRRSVARAL
jgi:hypothetical protein